MSENEALLLTFIKWYWKEVDGKPGDVRAEDIVKDFLDKARKNQDETD